MCIYIYIYVTINLVHKNIPIHTQIYANIYTLHEKEHPQGPGPGHGPSTLGPWTQHTRAGPDQGSKETFTEAFGWSYTLMVCLAIPT